MEHKPCIIATLCMLAAAGCSSESSGNSCDVYECDTICQAQGYRGGICESGICRCSGEPDGHTDTTGDTADDNNDDSPELDTAVDISADPEPEVGGFEPTPGTQAEVDRTETCNEPDEWRKAPQDPSVSQACMPNYNIWAPVVCGGPNPPCTCDASRCLPGEAAKTVNDGAFCVCLNLCTDQNSGATCGASGERECIPVDDYTGSQVFICGGL